MVSKEAAAAAIKAGRDHVPEDVLTAAEKWPPRFAEVLVAMWHVGMDDAGRVVLGMQDEEPISDARVIPSRGSDPSTSHAAAKAITVRSGTQRAKLLMAFATLTNATDEEAMERSTSVSPLSEYSKRCSELREAGFIEVIPGLTRTGQSGQARIVSQITEKGQEHLRRAIRA